MANSKYHRTHQQDLFIAITIIVFACVLKDSCKRTPGMIEFQAKHYAMFNCMQMYLAMHRYITSNTPYYKPNKTDIFLVTPGRSGTQFMLNLLYQIRTGGDDNFDDAAYLGKFFGPFQGEYGLVLNDPQPSPHVYWSHSYPMQIPSNKMTIFIARDPVNILLSWKHFITQMYQLHHEITVEDVLFNCIHRNCFWPNDFLWNMFALWFKSIKMNNSKKITSLWLHYEDITTTNRQRQKQIVQRIGNEFNVKINSTTMRRTLDRISLQYYKKFSHRFRTDRLQYNLALLMNYCMQYEKWKLTEFSGAKSLKMTQTEAISSKRLKQIFELKWRNIIQPATGYESYSEMLKHEQLKLDL